jgi:branched-chain amino acid transport system substrate-binding protein
MKPMKTSHLMKGAALGALLAAASVPANAQDSIYVANNAYRTGPFSGSGTPIGDGMRDYFAMINERDGGIGGVKIVFEE